MFSKLKDKLTSDVNVDVKSIDSSSTSDAPSYIEDATVHTYEIKYKDWKCITALVSDLESGEVLYQVEVPTITRSRMIFKSAGDEVEFGISKPNPYKMNLTAEVHGQDLQLHCKKCLSSDYVYMSPAFDNEKMTWTSKMKWKGQEFILLDDQSLPVAKWSMKAFAATNLGKLEFLGTKAESKQAREEILLTGLTLAYLMIMARNTGSAGAVSTIGPIVGS